MPTQRIRLNDGREVEAIYRVMETAQGPVRVNLERVTDVESGEPIQAQTPERLEVFNALQRRHGFVS